MSKIVNGVLVTRKDNEIDQAADEFIEKIQRILGDSYEDYQDLLTDAVWDIADSIRRAVARTEEGL